MSPARGFRLPTRYESPKHTFSGGQGKVYICKDKNLNRDVAIKIIKDITDTEAIQSEIASLTAIQSKHVVQLFDFIQDPATGSIAIVQEYLPGDDLSYFCNNGAADLGSYLKALYQIASGIADIHAYGKIHRDIKLINMKFDGENIIRIFDFGLSCDHQPPPVTNLGRGTDVYRAPELYNVPAEVTQAVDTYAFGVSAWEMLAPNFPQGLLEQPPQSWTAVPSFSTHSLTLPPEIVAVLDQTLMVDPADRPAMAQVRDVIATRLLFGKHEGRLAYNGNTYKISLVGQSVNVAVPGAGSFRIAYDGLKFVISNIVGTLDINNTRATDGSSLPGSCVLALNANTGGRRFLTFDISHPEVVL